MLSDHARHCSPQSPENGIIIITEAQTRSDFRFIDDFAEAEQTAEARVKTLSICPLND